MSKEDQSKLSLIFEEVGHLKSVHSSKAPLYFSSDNKLLTFYDDGEGGCLFVLNMDTFQPINSIKLKESITCFVPHPCQQTVFITTISHAMLEMDYLNGRIVNSSKTSHKQPVGCISINNEGTRMATGGSDGEVRIRHMGSGQSTIHICLFHQGKVTLLKLSPTMNLLASGSLLTSEIAIWNTESGELLSSLQGHQDLVTDVDYHENLMVSSARDHVIFIWDLKSFNKLTTIPTFQSTEVCCFFHPSKQFQRQQEPGDKESESENLFILTGSQYGGVLRVWSITQRRCVYPQQEINPDMNKSDVALLQCIRRIVRVPWSRAQHWILSEAEDEKSKKRIVSDYLLMVRENGTLQLWRESDLQLVQEFTFDLGEVNHLQLCGSRRDILLGGENSSYLRLFPFLMSKQNDKNLSYHCSVADAGEGMISSEDEGQTTEAVVLDVAVAEFDPSLVASVGKDCALSLWRVMEENIKGRPVKLQLLQKQEMAHARHITCVEFSRNGSSIFTCCVDMELKRWTNPYAIKSSKKKTSDGELTVTANVSHVHTDVVNKIACSVDNRYVATASKDKTIKIWLIEKEQLVLLHSLSGHRRGVWSVVFSPTEKKLLSVSGDNCVKMWSIDSGQQLLSLQENAKLYRSLFLPNGKDALIVNELGEVRVCNLDPHKPSPSQLLFSNPDRRLRSICLSPDEQKLFVGGQDGSLTVLQNITEKVRQQKKAEQELESQHEQELSNLILAKAYPTALLRAVQLDRPRTCLHVIETILDKETDGENVFTQTLEELEQEHLDRLMNYSMRWMNNTRTEHVAHLIQNFVYHRYNMTDLMEDWTCFKKSEAILQLGIRSADRAINRLNSTISLLGHIDFICHAMPKTHLE